LGEIIKSYFAALQAESRFEEATKELNSHDRIISGKKALDKSCRGGEFTYDRINYALCSSDYVLCSSTFMWNTDNFAAFAQKMISLHEMRDRSSPFFELHHNDEKIHRNWLERNGYDSVLAYKSGI
jgi:hypothetical protein